MVSLCGVHGNGDPFYLNGPRSFPVEMKELVTELAGPLSPTFHSKYFQVESRMTACMYESVGVHTDTHRHFSSPSAISR
uniref:Uncharacterized protein n=1 Tax=Myripristis murdjan TaxID=586833 RepID=A0A667XF26_9TELE